jgi:tRNA/tmRNA/rRNA uracil-C5-methylase (TrmA/RlmC/RlmD family)
VALAAARAGARGIGLDINPGLIRAANARAKTEQLDHLVQFQVAP